MLTYIGNGLYTDEFNRIWKVSKPGQYEMIFNPSIDGRNQINPDLTKGN